MANTINQVLRDTTLDYLSSIDMNNPPTPAEIEADVLLALENNFTLENALRSKANQWKIPQTLDAVQIATIMAQMHDIVRIRTAGDGASSDFDLLALYQHDGKDKGIYVTEESQFREIARQYNYRLRTKDFNEIMVVLRDLVPRKVRCRNRDLIAVNNGIFQYETKTLLDFSPDYIFLSKCRVDYNTKAKNTVIHNADDNTDWDIETWMSELSDDPEVVDILWRILGAIVRPLVSWNKSAWFYSESGNNGKGTLCQLMRNLLGEGSYASISLSDFSKDFALEPLIRANAIIVDENDVGTFIDKAANLKAVITNDVSQINRKFKMPVAYIFYGFMVQCLNDMPRTRDKSDSFFRRQIFVPFTKCFTGKERKYIKDDYLKRQHVLEYILFRVLHMNYYDLVAPAACQNALEQYKEFNDPVRQFVEEVVEEATWELLPFGFLYELYQAWFKKNAPSGAIQSRNTFINDLVNIVRTNDNWQCVDKNAKIRVGNRMTGQDPLAVTYDIKAWINPKLSSSYRGLVKNVNGAVPPVIMSP